MNRGMGSTTIGRRCSASDPVDHFPKENDEMMPDHRFVAWSPAGGVYRPTGPTVRMLPAGIYTLKADHTGLYFNPMTFHSDDLLRLPGLPIEFILNQIDMFWDRQERFDQCGLLHKRGILMYGAAGCGKTSIIKLLCDNIVERDGVVVLVDVPNIATEMLESLRQIEPERPVLTIIEDIDVFMHDDESKRELLSFLDGEKQIDHVVHLATTNHPDVLDETIVKRPGRFDVVIRLKPPVREAREAYLRHLLGAHISDTALDELVTATAGLGLAHLRELVSATYCLDLNTEETLARLKGNIQLKISEPHVNDREGLGFSVGFNANASEDA